MPPPAFPSCRRDQGTPCPGGGCKPPRTAWSSHSVPPAPPIPQGTRHPPQPGQPAEPAGLRLPGPGGPGPRGLRAGGLRAARGSAPAVQQRRRGRARPRARALPAAARCHGNGGWSRCLQRLRKSSGGEDGHPHLLVPLPPLHGGLRRGARGWGAGAPAAGSAGVSGPRGGSGRLLGELGEDPKGPRPAAPRALVPPAQPAQPGTARSLLCPRGLRHPRGLCHPCGPWEGAAGRAFRLRHSSYSNKHPKMPLETQPVLPPCQMCQLGTGWQGKQKPFFPLGKWGWGRGRRGRHLTKASSRSGSRAASSPLPSASPSPGAPAWGHWSLLWGRGAGGLQPPHPGAAGVPGGCGWG